MAISPIVNNVRRLRFEHGEMSQLVLARRIGVARQTVIAIESRKYSPSLETALRIAEVFDVPLERVFQFEKNPARARAPDSGVTTAAD